MQRGKKNLSKFFPSLILYIFFFSGDSFAIFIFVLYFHQGQTNYVYNPLIRGLIGTLAHHHFASHLQVKRVDMRQCGIAHIEDNSLRGMHHLTELIWNNNGITSLGPNTFSGAPLLEDIFLQYNLISTIAEGTFSVPHLRTLILANNRLQIISHMLFGAAPKLKRLSLAYNPLRLEETFFLPADIEILLFVPYGSINIQWFQSFKSLKVLILGQCDTNFVVWPTIKMLSLHTLELLPNYGFGDEGHIIRSLALFPSLHTAKYTIHTFFNGVGTVTTRQYTAHSHSVPMNG